MSPLLEEGDRLHVSYNSEVEPGDLLLCRGKESWVVHRYVPCGTQFAVKADRSLDWDDFSGAWGKVIAVERDRRLLPRKFVARILAKVSAIHRRDARLRFLARAIIRALTPFAWRRL